MFDFGNSNDGQRAAISTANGAVLITNHTKEAVTVDSIEIPAGSYDLRRIQ